MDLAFGWMNQVFRLGARRPLELQDLPLLPNQYAASTNSQLVRKAWKKQLHKRQHQRTALLVALFQCFWRDIFITGVLSGIQLAAAYLGICLLYLFVGLLENSTKKNALEVLGMASAFLVAKGLEIVSERQLFFKTQVLTLKLRSGLCGFVYSKALGLSSSSKLKHSSGQMINYMNSDVEALCGFLWQVHTPWTLLLQITLAVVFLTKALTAMASWVSLLLIVLGTAVNFSFTEFQKRIQADIATAVDARMKVTLECLKNMKAVKIHMWEKAFLAKLEALRDTEFGVLSKLVYFQGATGFLSWSFPMFVALATFSGCETLGVHLTAKSLLSALATFQMLQTNLESISSFLPGLSRTIVSLNRLSTFLQEEEVDANSIYTPDGGVSADVSPVVVSIKEATFSWEATIEKVTMLDVNLEVRRGTMVGVTGAVGSGKSSLLAAILGDIPKIRGKVTVRGRIAYVPQSAWIHSGTIESNILFGRPMDQERYELVIEACQLKKDLSMLQLGDQTEIGERGVNLSGGQKQRVQLARAVYSDADIYLLDDPFSALDSRTTSSILEKCVGRLLQGKTVLLATQHIHNLRLCNEILALVDRQIVQVSSYSDLQKCQAQAQQVHDDLDETTEYNDTEASSKLVLDEDRKRGPVSLSIYRGYLTAVRGGFPLIVIAGAHLAYQVIQLCNNRWLVGSFASNHPKPLQSYGIFFVISSLFLALRIFAVCNVGLQTAQKYYAAMLDSIFHAPIAFFDSTPSGRILTRASTDQNALDIYAPQRLSGFAFSSIDFLVNVGIMAWISPIMLFMFIPIMATCMWLQRYYAATIRELPRLIGLQKAPIINHFVQSLAGASTIRAFQQEASFMNQNLTTIDDYSRPVFYNFSAMECMALRIGLLVNTMFFAFLLMVAALPVYALDQALVGVAVTYALKLNTIVCTLVWDTCDSEKRMISAERIQQYINITKEASWSSAATALLKHNNWPSNGSVELKSLMVRYKPTGPLILKGLTCQIPGGKKISVVGRTGSGKSTLAQCLLRLVEPGKEQLFIDGVDVTTVGLHDLRNKIIMIPQEPTMFQGTVRYNLDPLSKHWDPKLWEVLEKCQLRNEILQRPLGLDCPIIENGDNWSVGQRQLFCLARMLLEKPDAKIVILDEATASVDIATQDGLQCVVFTTFQDRTIINITHRLHSIINSDMALVLSDGEIVQLAAPQQIVKFFDSDNSLTTTSKLKHI